MPSIIYSKKTGAIKSWTAGDVTIDLLPEGLGAMPYSGSRHDLDKKHVTISGRVVPIGALHLEESRLNAAWRDLRSRRHALLSHCDWTQVPDAPVDQAAWRAYRKALRDLPNNTQDPANVDWPIPPTT